MNTTIVAPNIDPNHSVAGHGWGVGLFMLLAVLGGCALVAKAMKICRREHDPHAPSYSHPTH